MALSTERLSEILGRFGSQRILVLGDLMLDEFLWGKVSRISPEAPVPVVDVQESSYFPGGAANVARNVSALGGKASVVGVTGDDEAGRQLKRLLDDEGTRTEGVIAIKGRPTTHKSRIIARQQQVVRVDRETKEPLTATDRARVIDLIRTEVAQHDAVIIEDYAKGLIDQSVVDAVIATAKAEGKIVTVDPNPKNQLQWTGARAIKPNRQEAFEAAGLPLKEGVEAAAQAGRKLQKEWGVGMLLLTMGEDGMLLLEEGGKPYHTPTRAQKIFDVSGAGDTAIAVFTLALAAGASGTEAAELANHAAGVVVGKLGTATLTPAELRESFGGVEL